LNRVKQPPRQPQRVKQPIAQTSSARAIVQSLQGKGKRTPAEVKILVALFMIHLAQGKSDVQIIEEMGLQGIKEYNQLKAWMYEQEVPANTNMPPEQLFIDYKLAQDGCIKALNDVIELFKETRQGNALVGAVRAKSDLLDKIVKRGNELGVLEKGKGRHAPTIIGGIDISNMTEIDIAIRIKRELKELDSIVGDNIIDVTPDDAELPPTTKIKRIKQ